MLISVLIGLFIMIIFFSYNTYREVKIYPIKSLGYIKITNFDRTSCKEIMRWIHPKTKSVVRRLTVSMKNCVPIWEKVSIE